jgi:hypothetical protein
MKKCENQIRGSSSDMAENIRREIAKLIITSAGLEAARDTRFALKAAIPWRYGEQIGGAKALPQVL